MSKSYFRKTSSGKYLSGNYANKTNSSGPASRLRSAIFRNNINADPEDKFCLKCGELLPKWTPTFRIYRSEFCSNEHKQSYYNIRKYKGVTYKNIRVPLKIYNLIASKDKEKYILESLENKVNYDFLQNYFT